MLVTDVPYAVAHPDTLVIRSVGAGLQPIMLTAGSSAFSNGGSNFNRQVIVSSSGSNGFSSSGLSSGGFSSSSDDLCSGFTCGSNANCLIRSSRAVCSCRGGFEGDPYTGCRRSECIENVDCPSDKVCQHNRCISPCSTSCGVDAE